MELQKEELAPEEQRLSQRELNAYRAWKGLCQPRLSPDTQARFFALFLKGESCDDIVGLNRGFSLGQICFARIEGHWDERRDAYLEDLLGSARTIVQQTALESIRFVADQLAAVHKKWGEAARRYIQNGDEQELKSFGIDDIKTYKQAVETLQKLTGQDAKAQEVQHHHTIEAIAPAHRPLTGKEAAQIVGAAAAKRRK